MKLQRWCARTRMTSRRSGFTTIEVMVVMVLAGVLVGLAVPQFNSFMSRRQVINARDAFSLTAARARAAAVERGDVVVLQAKVGTDSVVVVSANGADTLQVLDLVAGETTASVIVENTLTICFVPRGFAHPACGTGNLLPARVGFSNGSTTLWSVMNAVGQVEKQ